MVTIGTAAAIGVAVVALLIGVLYDRVWLPSRPVVQVAGTTLSRGGYNTERRYAIAREITQNLQLTKLFGGQLSGQFAGRTPALNSEVKTISANPVDQTTIDQWIDRQVLFQSADKMGLKADDGEVTQAMVVGLSDAFPPPAAPVSGTAGLTPTAVLSATASAPTGAAGTARATSAAAATSASTPTEPPTLTPKPTPGVEAAKQDESPLIDRVFSSYQQDLLQTDSQLSTNLTKDDFLNGLRDQYREQVLTTKVEEQLVPDSSFQPNSDPSAIETRQILLRVTLPVSGTQAENDAAYAKRKAEIDAISQRLKGGADFATVAKEKSEDPASKADGGTMPSFDKTGKTTENTQIDPEYLKAALALKDGEISQPFRTPFGWHIIQVVKKTVPSREEQLRTKRTEAFDKWKQEQRQALAVKQFPEQTPSPSPLPTGTAAPLPTFPLERTLVSTPVPTNSGTGTPTPTTAQTSAATRAATAAATSAATAAATSAATSAATAAPTGAATSAATSAATAAATSAATGAATAAPTGASTTPTSTP
jgi:parvulin-like peptidyl-prolyl isomerase